MKIFRNVLIVLTTLVVGLSLCHFLLTGMFVPQSIIEELKNPQQVLKVTSQGFVMEDGSIVRVKHISELPTDSEVLNAAIKNGIEVNGDGYIVGLINIHHWCGNDPVRYHLARVDLTSLILASGGKESSEIPGELLDSYLFNDQDIRMSEWGLNISDYHSIQRISGFIASVSER